MELFPRCACEWAGRCVASEVGATGEVHVMGGRSGVVGVEIGFSPSMMKITMMETGIEL
jgi:hypothetical protein